MKKILLSSIVLIAFSASIIIFQLSCRKTAIAQNSGPNLALNKILLTKYQRIQIGTTPPDSLGNTTPIYKYYSDFYFVNYDGSNPSKINIPLPAGIYPHDGKLNADETKLVFKAATEYGSSAAIYTYALDGSSLVQIADSSYVLQGAY